MKEHDCFQHLEINDKSQGSGSTDYLICKECKETFSNHIYCLWVRPYPHLDDDMVQKTLNHFGYDFQDDGYAEVQVSDTLKIKYPSIYDDPDGWYESKGSYFFDFSDEKTKQDIEKKIDELDMLGFCHAFIQDT